MHNTHLGAVMVMVWVFAWWSCGRFCIGSRVLSMCACGMLAWLHVFCLTTLGRVGRSDDQFVVSFSTLPKLLPACLYSAMDRFCPRHCALLEGYMLVLAH